MNDFHMLNAYEVEPLLRKIHRTAPGEDHIPYWVLGQCSYKLAEVVAHI
jgi:hypothetical protein